MSTAHLVIDTHDLSMGYDGVAALDGLDLQVPQNSIFGFLGPNGAGKTTGMKRLLGLSKPTKGRAGLFGLSQRPTAAPPVDGSDTRTRSAFLLPHDGARNPAVSVAGSDHRHRMLGDQPDRGRRFGREEL